MVAFTELRSQQLDLSFNCLAGIDNVGIRAIYCPEEVGIDFGHHFDDELVDQALQLLVECLPGCIGYALRFETGQNCDSWFVPALPSVVKVPARIPFLNLVLDTWTWPVLAEHQGRIASLYEPDEIIATAKWRGQIRLQTGKKFVGYFKIVHVDPSTSPPSDSSLTLAAYRVRSFVDDQVWQRESRQLREKVEVRDSFRATHRIVRRAISANQTRLALRHLATLLTSHLCSWLNRISVFVPLDQDSLECVHAHGDHGHQIQEFLGSAIRTVDQLHAEIESHPLSDPFFAAAAGANPLRVDIHSAALLAQLWRAHGNVRALPAENQVIVAGGWNWDNVASDSEVVIAAKFFNDDPWIKDIHDSDGGRAFIVDDCDYFVLPWFASHQSGHRSLIGLVVVDLSDWTEIDLYQDVIPRLRFARIALSEFANYFADCALRRNWR